MHSLYLNNISYIYIIYCNLCIYIYIIQCIGGFPRKGNEPLGQQNQLKIQVVPIISQLSRRVTPNQLSQLWGTTL